MISCHFLNFKAVFDFGLTPRKVMVWKHFQSAKTAVQIKKYNARVKVDKYLKVLFTESLSFGLGIEVNRTPYSHPHGGLTLFRKTCNKDYDLLTSPPVTTHQEEEDQTIHSGGEFCI